MPATGLRRSATTPPPQGAAPGPFGGSEEVAPLQSVPPPSSRPRTLPSMTAAQTEIATAVGLPSSFLGASSLVVDGFPQGGTSGREAAAGKSDESWVSAKEKEQAQPEAMPPPPGCGGRFGGRRAGRTICPGVRVVGRDPMAAAPRSLSPGGFARAQSAPKGGQQSSRCPCPPL